MSRGLGPLQKQVLLALGSASERDYELPLRLLKISIFGEVRGQLYPATGQKIINCTSSQAHRLNRAISSLVYRGLVREWTEQDYNDFYRHFVLTDNGLSEYNRLYSLSD